MKDSYRGFAPLYDALTFDVDYDAIADFVQSRLRAHGISEGLVLDLACGTGTLTRKLAGMGYDMIGIDGSEDMLSVARQKTEDKRILYLNQPMEDFELYGTVDAIVCVLDSVNYLTEPETFSQMLSLCANYLNPNGLLIFDVNSIYKFTQVLGEKTYAYETEDIFYSWENEYNPETQLCDLYLTFFVKEEGGLYRRIDEVHVQRAYTDGEIKKALEDAGFSLKGCYDDYQDKSPGAISQRIVYEANKK